MMIHRDPAPQQQEPEFEQRGVPPPDAFADSGHSGIFQVLILDPVARFEAERLHFTPGSSKLPIYYELGICTQSCLDICVQLAQFPHHPSPGPVFWWPVWCPSSRFYGLPFCPWQSFSCFHVHLGLVALGPRCFFGFVVVSPDGSMCLNQMAV